MFYFRGTILKADNKVQKTTIEFCVEGSRAILYQRVFQYQEREQCNISFVLRLE